MTALLKTYAEPHVKLKPRLHNTTCCQTGLTTGCIAYTNIQPAVKPV